MWVKEGQPDDTATRLKGNHFWDNGEDVVRISPDNGALYGDPKYTDPASKDYSVQPGSALVGNDSQPQAGLLDPEPIRRLWEIRTSKDAAQENKEKPKWEHHGL